MLLGNEAMRLRLSHASHRPEYQRIPAIFCFQDQLPPSEFAEFRGTALLRGRDNRDTALTRAALFKSAFLNFTLGMEKSLRQ
jgi:hypothetical protein